jgi:hypothetical protein
MANINPQLVSLADHPRARESIRAVKAWAGLLGFVAVAGYGYQRGTDPADCILHALVAGILFQFLGWIGAVVVWQHLLDAEATAAVRRVSERRRAQRESAQRATRE